MNDDEFQLVEDARRGDSLAIEKLYTRYFDKVFSYVFHSTGNKQDAEDIAAEVFVRMIEKLDNFRWKGSSFSSWLFRIAHNLVVDRHRFKLKFAASSLDTEDAGLVVGDIDLEKIQGEREQKIRLINAYKSLRPRYGEVIYLKLVIEMNNAEIAEVMRLTKGAVNTLYYRALKEIEKKLSI